MVGKIRMFSSLWSYKLQVVLLEVQYIQVRHAALLPAITVRLLQHFENEKQPGNSGAHTGGINVGRDAMVYFSPDPKLHFLRKSTAVHPTPRHHPVSTSAIVSMLILGCIDLSPYIYENFVYTVSN